MARIRTIKPEFWVHPVMGRLSDLAKWVAVALLNHADDEGFFRADPAIVRGAIAPFTDDSLSIHGALTECSRAGWLEIREHPTEGVLGKVVNFLKHQRINRPNASKLKDYWEFSECSVSTHGALSEDSHPEGKGRGREEEGKRNRERHPKSEMGKDVCDRFTRWYEGDGNGYRGYPRKVGRGAAEKAFAAVNPTEDLLDQMIQATKGQASSPAWVKDGGQFIPHPATWLNQRRWLDRTEVDLPALPPPPAPKPPRKCWEKRFTADGNVAGWYLQVPRGLPAQRTTEPPAWWDSAGPNAQEEP